MSIQLDTKTVYTFLDSVVTIDKYISMSKQMGYDRLGIMDIDNLYAASSFLEATEKAGIQGLLGMETSMVWQEQEWSIRLLALNAQGYRNLMKWATHVQLGQKDWDQLKEWLDGLALIVAYAPYVHQLELDVDFYIGVYPDSPVIDYPRPILPLYTVRYFEEEDLETVQMLGAIRENVSLVDAGRPNAHQELVSSKDLLALFQESFPDAIDNLERLTAEVHYDLDRSLKLPRFNPGQDAAQQLRLEVERGLASKGLTAASYQERKDTELAVIHDMGFDDYFLIVWDLLRFGRMQGYYMGMGRGSAVGSLVAYALDITGIDPVKNNLVFERFLNRERYTMPDIDIDIPDIVRPEFLRYVRDRYGSMHSAQIVTFSTFGAKQALRDVLKRYGVPEYELTNMTRRIGFRDNLASAYKGNASFRQAIHSRPEYEKAFQLAKKIEGQPRQTSVHAAGVVIADEDLTDFIPLKFGEDMLITQYDAHAVESIGLLKMDFLGLRNLTLVEHMRDLLKEREGIEIAIEDIDLEDPETLALFAKGATKGIFQFEQPGAIHLLRRVKPQRFEEVVATTSLNRPGASDYIDHFVARKREQEPVEIIDPVLTDILVPTYGIMLYQEQVMQVAQVYAGFTLGKADILRRAMGKKDSRQMQEMEAEFVAGALALGHQEEKAREVFAIMAKFAGYGFNRSHAYAYSALAFQMAYFKTHYPEIFFQVMLNYANGDYLQDALAFGLELAPLHINRIPYQDKVEKGRIYLGLKQIKGLPRDLAFWILDDRPFQSVEDFLLRLPKTYHKPAVIQPLIRLGLFDAYEPNRGKIEGNLEHLFVFVDELGSLFADSTYAWTQYPDFSAVEKYGFEQDLIGIGLSPHPLLEIAKRVTTPVTPVKDLVVGKKETVLVQLQASRIIRTKNGDQMAFLTVTDTHKKLDVTVFPETYQRLRGQLKEGDFFLMSGRVQERDGRIQLILDHLQKEVLERFWILLTSEETDAELAAILRRYPGDIPVILRYEAEGRTVAPTNLRVRVSEELEEALRPLVLKTVFR